MKKIHITTKRFYKSLFQGILFPTTLMLMLINTGCKKEPGIEPAHKIDSSFYLTLNMNGKTYTSYAWSGEGEPSYYPSIYGIFEIITDPPGTPINWDLNIKVLAEFNSRAIQIPSTFSASIAIFKQNDLLGQYIIDNAFENKFSDVDGKSYRIDPTSSYFYLQTLSPPATSIPYVDGNFQCTLYEIGKSKPIPIRASGSFRLRAF